MDAAAMLREARLEAGQTQRDLALGSGLPQPEVSRIERGHVSPRVETLDRLLRACGRELTIRPRLGAGVDRSLIAERLSIDPGARVRRTVEEWRGTGAFRPRGR